MSLIRQPKIENLNLIPLMNLFVTMIPLLLLTAAFYHIGMIATSVPTQSDEESDAPTGKTSVTVNIRITDKGYSLTASSATLGDAELKALDRFIAKKGKDYDNEALTKALEVVKRKYEQSDTIMLFPNKKTTYRIMVKAMDAARNMIVTYKGKKRKVALFPVVVVSSLVE